LRHKVWRAVRVGRFRRTASGASARLAAAGAGLEAVGGGSALDSTPCPRVLPAAASVRPTA